MGLRRRSEKIFKGWFPKEAYTVNSKENCTRKSSATAYIVGYGVGIGICETLIILVNLLGWGAIRGSLSQPSSIILGMLVIFPETMLGLVIGAKLSKKLKERWQKTL